MTWGATTLRRRYPNVTPARLSAIASDWRLLRVTDIRSSLVAVAAGEPMTIGDDRGLRVAGPTCSEASRVEQLEDHIHRVVEAAPPLTAEQRDRLALLLAPEDVDRAGVESPGTLLGGQHGYR